MTTKLTEEQILLGQFYTWLHRRAEHLRKQKAAAITRQDEPAAAHNTPAMKPEKEKYTAMTAKKRNSDALKQLSGQAQRRIEATKVNAATLSNENQSAETESAFTDEPLDTLAEVYALLNSPVDEEVEARQYWPESVLAPICFLQGRTSLTIDLEGQTLLLPNIKIGYQVDCVNHLLTEAADLKRLCLSHNAFVEAETCERVIDLAQRTRKALDAKIPVGGGQ